MFRYRVQDATLTAERTAHDKTAEVLECLYCVVGHYGGWVDGEGWGEEREWTRIALAAWKETRSD